MTRVVKPLARLLRVAARKRPEGDSILLSSPTIFTVLDDLFALRLADPAPLADSLLRALRARGFSDALAGPEWEAKNSADVSPGLVSLAATYEREGFETIFVVEPGSTRVRLLARPRSEAPSS